MADYRRPYEWFGEEEARRRRAIEDRDERDDRDERHAYGGDRNSRYEPSRDGYERGSRWEAGTDDRAYGMYRTDDRDYHARHRHQPARSERPSHDRYDAANEYYRAARDQRDDYMRWSAQNMGTWGDQGHVTERDGGVPPAWAGRERGGYWRQYQQNEPHHIGRGPKGYQRSDERVREEICDCMTDDPLLDASEIVVEVIQGEVTLSGTVTSRDQKRRAEDVVERISGVRDVTNQLRVMRDTAGHSWASDSSRASGPANASSQPVNEASGTPSKSTSSSTA